MTEFELIEKYFTRAAPHALIGNGDDAAAIAPSPQHAFVVTTDTMIEGRHFLPTLDPFKLGSRLVQVNLSDLAAMGATPKFAMLSLALPRIDEAWIARVAEGLWSALDEYDIELIGGNTTRGHLSLAMTAFGEVPIVDGKADALLRSGARVGDDVWVSGTLGDAGWALGCMTGEIDASATREQIAKYEMPTARVALGVALRGVATSCIDVSDGLLSEANHIAYASGVAIDVEFAHIPTMLGEALADARLRAKAQHALLSTGDAYELLFTAPQEKHDAIAALMKSLKLSGRAIGEVREHAPLRDRVQVLDSTGRAIDLDRKGWDHFA
ncbi:MAG: thiamine-phosphate kinase [Casimicrobium sp.]